MASATTTSSGQVTFTYAQLEGIWIAAGGNPQNAAMAAAVAMAESGGSTQATDYDSNGSVDRGLWQINSVNGSQSSYDVMTNARAAVALSNNGTNWRPWCTAWNGGCCGCGTYLGPGSPALKYYNTSTQPDTSVPLNATQSNTPTTTPTGSNTTSSQAPSQQAQTTSWLDWLDCITLLDPLECIGKSPNIAKDLGLDPITWIENSIAFMLNPLIQMVAGVLGMAAGGLLVISGAYMLSQQTQTGRQAKRAVTGVAQGAAMLAAPEAAPEEAAAGEASTRIWETRTAPTSAYPQGRVRRTTQVHYPSGHPQARDGAVTLTTQEYLDNEAGAYQ